VLPGILCAAMFPALIGSHFPGAIYLSQTLKFRQPALVRLPCILC
jgi:3-hydroxybutyryl-CoA dehydratase